MTPFTLLRLLPAPRSLRLTDGICSLYKQGIILLQTSRPGALLPIARRLQQSLRQNASVTAEISAADWEEEAETLSVRLVLDPQIQGHAQRYRLQVVPTEIRVEASTQEGLFYGVCTLQQLLQQCGNSLPCLEIDDWPDLDERGVMLDISRDKVPTMETLFYLVDLLASWKINQLQLYTEHTFAYHAHPEVWADASPMTGEQILELDAFCRERFVKLIPCQNTFGHMARWLTHPRYQPLAETMDAFPVPWGNSQGPFSLCPIDPGSLQLVEGLLQELLPHFSTSQVNIGCDETFDVGQGRSRDVCQQRGRERVYLDYVLSVREIARQQGRTIQFWGDILAEHPELCQELPRDVTILEWGHEADHPFAEHCQRLAEAQIPFYTCPGVSSWLSLGGRVTNALENLRNAAEAARTYGAAGYLITDWGDMGHWQPLPVSFIGYVAGAAYAWCLERNRDEDMPTLASHFAFGDDTGRMGSLAAQLGNIYLHFPVRPNFAPHFAPWLFPMAMLANNPVFSQAASAFAEAGEEIRQCAQELTQVSLKHPDAALILREYALVARLMDHAGQRVAFAHDLTNQDFQQQLREDLQGILDQFRQVWLARNRVGGLKDSIARMERILADEYGAI